MSQKKHILWGVAFLLGALALVLGGLGILEGIGFFSILFSILLAASCINGLFHRQWGQFLFSAALLAILAGKYMGGLPLSPWLLLCAAFFGTIGLHILFPGKHHPFSRHTLQFRDCQQFLLEPDDPSDSEPHASGASGASQTVCSGEHLNCEVNFSSAVKYIHSQKLSRVNAESSFARLSLYFDHAALKDGHAVVSADIAFGSLELYVPKEWNVEVNMENTFSRIEETGRCNPDSSTVLTITGDAAFATLRICYL